MIVENNHHPFLIEDISKTVLFYLSIKSKNLTLDLNHIRLVSCLFQKLVDTNSSILYSEDALKRKKVYLDFFSIFSDSLVTFDRIPTTTYSFSKMKKKYLMIDPNELLAGYEKKHGPFIVGTYLVTTRFRDGKIFYEQRKFLVSPSYYRESRSSRSIKLNLPKNIKYYNLLKKMLSNGYVYHNHNEWSWPGYEDWKEKHHTKAITL